MARAAIGITTNAPMMYCGTQILVRCWLYFQHACHGTQVLELIINSVDTEGLQIKDLGRPGLTLKSRKAIINRKRTKQMMTVEDLSFGLGMSGVDA